MKVAVRLTNGRLAAGKGTGVAHPQAGEASIARGFRALVRGRGVLLIGSSLALACSHVQIDDQENGLDDPTLEGDGDGDAPFGSGGNAFSSSGGALFGSGGIATSAGGTDGGAASGGAGTGGAGSGGGAASGGAGTGGAGSGGSSSASCSAPAWDATTNWTEYSVGDLRSVDGAEWRCTSPGWCWKDPTGADGSLGWEFVQDCDGAGSGGAVGSGGAIGSGGAGSGGAGSGGAVGTGGSSSSDCDGIEDILSSGEFNAFFPNRNGAYTYQGMVDAIEGAGDLIGFPAFAREGSCDTRKREVAAFLANVSRETGKLIYIEQIDKSYPYCSTQTYGCPAGTYQYYGRGPIQLSWNYNYYQASMALFGDDRLLQNPGLVASDSAIAWATAIWFWMTSDGAGVATCHEVMVSGLGFGETIRTINGVQECNGGNSPAVSQRVCAYETFVAAFGTTTGPGTLDCGTTVNRGAYCE